MFRWLRLPTGLSTVPALMQTVARSIAHILETTLDVAAIPYLNDFAALGPEDALLQVRHLLDDLCVKIHPHKSNFQPRHAFAFLDS